MKGIFLLLLAFFTVIAKSEPATPTFVSSCSVKKVYTGPYGTFIELEKCKGELSFAEKRIELEHHAMKSKDTRTGNVIYHDRVDTSLDVLAMKSTAELAMLFQRQVKVEMGSANGDTINFISLVDSVDLEGGREWKPVLTRPSPQPIR